mgnify:CR=1 FL=1
MKRLKKTYSLTVKRGIYQAVIYFPQPDGKRKAILHGGPQNTNSAAHLKPLDFLCMVQDAYLLCT